MNIVITGGDGALGTAVVAAFETAGATCHLPVLGATPTAPVPGAVITGNVNLTDEAAVVAYYASLPPIAASQPPGAHHRPLHRSQQVEEHLRASAALHRRGGAARRWYAHRVHARLDGLGHGPDTGRPRRDGAGLVHVANRLGGDLVPRQLSRSRLRIGRVLPGRIALRRRRARQHRRRSLHLRAEPARAGRNRAVARCSQGVPVFPPL